MRFPSFPALERTAVMGFSVPATLTLPASTAVKMALFRQASYPLWADQAFTTETYQASWNTEATATATSVATTVYDISAPVAASVTGFFAGAHAASSLAVGVTGGTVPATTSGYVPFGVDLGTGPNPFIFVPSNWILNAVVNATTGTVTSSLAFVVNYEMWASPGEIGTASFARFNVIGGNTGGCSSTGTPATFSNGTWVRPRALHIEVPASSTYNVTQWTVTFVVSAGTQAYTPSAATYGSIAVTSAARTSLYPVSYPVEFSNSTLPWYSTRVTASAFLGTNVTQIQKKGGTILAGRVAPTVQNPWAVNQSYVNGLHPAEKAFLPLETGVYSYCPPSTDLASFWDYTLPTSVGSNSGISCPVMRLDNDSLVNILYITATSDPEQLAVTLDWHIEFRTSSALFPIGLSAMTLESLHTAQLALASVGFFFENPSHKSLLERVVGAAKAFAPQAAGLLAGPTAAKLVKGAIMLANRPSSNMKTTTAQASGWNGPKPSNKPKRKKGNKKKAAPIGPRRKNGRF